MYISPSILTLFDFFAKTSGTNWNSEIGSSIGTETSAEVDAGVAKASTNLKANTNYFVPFALGKDQSSARAEAANHWSADNPNNFDVLYPRLHTNNYANNTLNSTWWYRNASFLRLKNVELGYQFESNLLKKIRVENLRIYVQGANVHVWDHIKLWDPEIGNSGARYPLTSTWTFGLDITF